jgi:hypothetical protein
MENPINDQVCDSRDLIEYKEYLENEILEAYIEWAENHNDFKDEGDIDLQIPDTFEEIEFLAEEAFTMTCEDITNEYDAIEDFCNELESYGDFEYGEAIISENYFTEYAEELTKDCGYLPDNLPSFIADNIDWKGVADDLKVDYTEADYEGTTYYMRA